MLVFVIVVDEGIVSSVFFGWYRYTVSVAAE